MTLPHEEVRSLKRSRELMTKLGINSWGPLFFLKLTLSKKARLKFRSEIYGCLKHFPFDFTIDRHWADEVCPECGDSNPWHTPECSRGKKK